MKSTNLLTQEHKLILRALDVLDGMAGLVDSGGKVDEVDVDILFDFLRWFADSHHQAKEETILFPALKSAAASQGRSVEHMAFEHKQERSLVEDLETNVRLAQISDFVAAANRLSSTLRNHIYKEDRILFENANQVLTPQEDDAVFEQLSRFDTALDKQSMDEKLQQLRALEKRYLRK